MVQGSKTSPTNQIQLIKCLLEEPHKKNVDAVQEHPRKLTAGHHTIPIIELRNSSEPKHDFYWYIHGTW